MSMVSQNYHKHRQGLHGLGFRVQVLGIIVTMIRVEWFMMGDDAGGMMMILNPKP